MQSVTRAQVKREMRSSSGDKGESIKSRQRLRYGRRGEGLEAGVEVSCSLCYFHTNV